MEAISLDDGSRGREIHPIEGMESVVATVSGYHGNERFKLIKLISHTGANYVGAMGRSTTHLVCWRLEGKKYDLSRDLGTTIVSHRWFEDCLKAGKRLPEDQYTMRSGQDVGPILWEVPDVLETHAKKKCLLTKERDALSDRSNVLDHQKCLEINARWTDSGHISQSFARLLNEGSSKIKGSKMVGNIKKASKKEDRSGNKDYSGSHVNGISILPEESIFLSSSRPKRNLSDTYGNDTTSQSARRSRRLAKKHVPDIMNYSPLGSKQKNCIRESYDCSEGRIHRIAEVEDIGEPSRNPLVKESCSPVRCNAFSSEGISHSEQRKHKKEETIADCGGKQNTYIEAENDQGESTGSHLQPEVSCVICWTDFCSIRGVLSCGHRFCYSCIEGWADCMASKGRIATCPLCKTGFTSITKFEESAFPDQKIYSQTIPCSSSRMDIQMLSDNADGTSGPQASDSICYECHNHEPEDLLVSCHLCQRQWVHTYCLDPPLFPWTCIHCRDLRMLYQRFR